MIMNQMVLIFLSFLNGKEVPGEFWIRFTSPHPKNFSKN